MHEESGAMSFRQAVQYLAQHAELITLPLSMTQARAVAEVLEPLSAQECVRALACIQAFTTREGLSDLPSSFWGSAERTIQVASIVLSYLVAGLKPRERDVLWLSFLLKNRSSYELFETRLELDRAEVSACVSSLERQGLLCSAEHGKILSPAPPLLEYEGHVIDWNGTGERALLLTHARALHEQFPAEMLWEACFNSVAERDLASGLLMRREELGELVRRLRHVDSSAWARTACMVLICDLFQGNIAVLDELGEQIVRLHGELQDPVLAIRVLTIFARIKFPHSGQLHECLELLEHARHRLIHVDDPDVRDALELGIVLGQTFFYERMNIEMDRVAQELEASYVRHKDHTHIPEALHVTMLRFMSRLQFNLGHDERARGLAMQALERARESQQEGLICIGLLEVAESCSRLGQDELFEEMFVELLERCDVECFPGFVHYVRLALGYYYFGMGKVYEARHLFAGSLPYFEESAERHNYQFVAMMLAVIDIEEGKLEHALAHLHGLADGLDVTRAHAVYASPQLVLVICAVLYAMCDELHLAQRVLHDALAYKARCVDTTYMSWGIDYVTAHVQVIQAVLDPAHHGSLSEHTELLDTLRAQRQGVDDAELRGEGLLYFRQGLDRLMDVWLVTHGVSVKSPIQIHVDAWEPTWFAVNHLPRVSIKRRQAMRRLLTALLHRGRSPIPEPISLEDMFQLGWPGEIASYESMQARVYNTISRMRKLGLDELIIHDGEGYQWNTSCEVVLETGRN